MEGEFFARISMLHNAIPGVLTFGWRASPRPDQKMKKHVVVKIVESMLFGEAVLATNHGGGNSPSTPIKLKNVAGTNSKINRNMKSNMKEMDLSNHDAAASLCSISVISMLLAAAAIKTHASSTKGGRETEVKSLCDSKLNPPLRNIIAIPGIAIAAVKLFFMVCAHNV